MLQGHIDLNIEGMSQNVAETFLYSLKNQSTSYLMTSCAPFGDIMFSQVVGPGHPQEG